MARLSPMSANISQPFNMEIKDLQDEVSAWADAAFPDRPMQSALLKLYEEIGEMVRDIKNPSEHADVYILMLDISKMAGVDVEAAILKKLEVNRSRTWQRTNNGTMQHMQEDDGSTN